MAYLTKSLVMPDGEYEFVGKTWYGVCTTAAATNTKTVNISGFTSADLVAGTRVTILFRNNNTAMSTSLNVSSTGAKSVLTSGYGTSGGDVDTDYSVAYEWRSGLISFVYDGYKWIMESQQHATTTYYGKTKLSNTISNDETVALTPKAVYDAGFLTLADLPIYDGSVT